MTPPGARLRLLAGIALLVSLAAYFGWQSIAAHVLRLAPSWLIFACGLIVAASLLSAYNRHLFINVERQLSFREFLPVYWVSWATGLLIPGQVGDVATMSAMMRSRGMQIHQSLGRSLLDKLTSFIVVGSFGLAGFANQLSGVEFAPLTATMHTLAALAAVAGVAICALAIPKFRTALSRGLRYGLRLASDAWGEGRRTAARYPGRVATNLSLSLVSFILLGLSYWAMFRALGYSALPVAETIAAAAACSLIAYVPISFNGIGTSEFGGIVLFGQFGIEGAAVISAFICLRLIVYTVAWLPAGIALFLSARDTGPVR